MQSKEGSRPAAREGSAHGRTHAGADPVRETHDAVLLKVKVICRSARNEISGVRNGELVVRIKAVPERGKANRELVAFLAKELSIPKASIRIQSGKSAQHKLLCFPVQARDALESILPRG
jgi:uncharacterized protein (TIGR00251 family)